MKFVVDYRGPDGSRQQKEIEATDRKSAFEQLSRMGISAITLSEGPLSKKPRSTVNGLSVSASLVKSVAVVLVVVVAIVAVVWVVVFGRSCERKVKDASVEVVSDIEREKKASDKLTHEQAQDDKPERAKTEETLRDEKILALMDGKNTNDWMVVEDANGSPKVIRVFHPGYVNGEPPPKPLFRHSSENEIAAIAFGDIGERVIGISVDSLFRKDLAEALAEKIEIFPEDSEEVRQKKIEMEQIKDMLRNALKDGSDPCKIVQDAIDERNRLATYRENLLQEIADSRRNGMPEEDIDLLREAANKLLEEKGAKLIKSKAEMAEQMRRKINERNGARR